MKRSTLAPMSERKKAQLAAEERQEREEAGPFRAIIVGEKCVVCGRSEQEAYDETGWGHQAHHAIRKEVLKRLKLHAHLWDPRNAVATCEEPCHRQHTSRSVRIPRAKLPKRLAGFVKEHQLGLELEREYPS